MLDKFIDVIFKIRLKKTILQHMYVFINPRSQMRGLYAMMLSIFACLFVCLSVKFVKSFVR